MNLEQLKRQYLEYLEIEKGRGLKTIANYDRYLTRFLDYSKLTDPKDITDNTLREYRLWLNRQESREVTDGRKENLKKIRRITT